MQPAQIWGIKQGPRLPGSWVRGFMSPFRVRQQPDRLFVGMLAGRTPTPFGRFRGNPNG